MAIKHVLKRKVREIIETDYEIVMNDAFLKELQEDLQKGCLETLPQITMEDVIQVWQRGDYENPDHDKEYLWDATCWFVYAPNRTGSSKLWLSNVMHDYLDQVMWEQEEEVYDSEYLDSEDYYYQRGPKWYEEGYEESLLEPAENEEN